MAEPKIATFTVRMRISQLENQHEAVQQARCRLMAVNGTMSVVHEEHITQAETQEHPEEPA